MTTKDSKDARLPNSRSQRHGATDAIGMQLKQYYKSVEQEPIPGQLLDLLEKLDEAERSGGSNAAN